ncbi:hypothetical protein KUTeg_011059 [Tegillarca granosa]|uniref:HAT C-terminal dimerisation domain-containing protein n=1 Tax=Tegillarca granosa TaxID=220873 RepID=A0ABQ9F2R3_TEGGR|nr:hypothetical protein KUTeg_011059 [Tegillarca granosa]
MEEVVQVESKQNIQEQAVKIALDTVYWLGKENIPTEKYPSLLELLNKHCSSVKDLNKAKNATYNFRIIANEMQQAIADALMYEIVDSMKQARWISVLTDESTDITVKGKLIIYVKFVDINFDVKSHYLRDFEIGEKGAATFTDMITSVLKERASVMTGVKNGVSARLKKLSPYLTNIHCVAHRLTLCTSQAATKLDTLQQYKTVLTNLYYYFKGSSVRSSRLAKIQEVFDLPQIKVREMHDIKWFSFYNVLEGIYKSWDALLELYLEKKDGLYTAEFKSLLVEQDGEVKLYNHALEHEVQQEKLAESTISSFVENLINNLQKRFPSDSLSILSACEALAMRDLSFVSQSEDFQYGTDKIEILLDQYATPKGDPMIQPPVNGDKAKSEYALLKPLVLQQQYPRDKLDVLWKIIFQFHKEQFPNLIELATIVLSMPVQTAICERGFSVQNPIKTAPRNRLGDARLRILMTISIEGPSFKKFDSEKSFNEFKTKKKRRIFQKLTCDIYSGNQN